MDNPLKKFYNDRFRGDADFSMADQERLKAKIFDRLGETVSTAAEATTAGQWIGWRRIFTRSYVIVPLVCVLFLTGTGIVSAKALPGDPLYVVKRKIEDARVFIAPSEEAKEELQVNFAEKRLEELEKLRGLEVSKEEVSTEDNNSKDAPKAERKDSEDRGKQKNDNEDEERDRGNHEDQRRARARQQAQEAYQFLQSVQQRWEQKGEERKSEEIHRRMENFEMRLQDHRERRSDEDNDRESRDNDDR
jgi:hypothetical protein